MEQKSHFNLLAFGLYISCIFVVVVVVVVVVVSDVKFHVTEC